MRGRDAARAGRHGKWPAIAGAAAVIGLALSAGWAPAPARAANAPTIAGHTNGNAGCQQLTYRKPGSTTNELGVVEPTPCDQWSIDVLPATPTSWQLDEERRIATSVPGGIAVESKVHEGVLADLTLDADGELASASIVIEATGEVSGGSYGVVDDSTRIEFDATSTLTLKGQMVVDGSGDDNASGSGSVRVEISCTVPPGSPLANSYNGEAEAAAGAGVPSPASNTVPIDTQLSSEGRCSLNLHVGAGSSIAPWATAGSAGTGHARLELTITAAAIPCDLTGIVRTADFATDGHGEPMPGVTMDLYKGVVDHSRAPDASTLTDDAGRYCFRGVSPDPYMLEAQLTDRSTLTLREQPGDPPIAKVVAIAASDFNSGTDRDVNFSDPGDILLDDDAYLYWQSWRFIDWLLQEGVVLPAELGDVSMSFAGPGSETRYDPASSLITISQDDGLFFDREAPDDRCPEDCEWHEISHHVAHELGIADRCANSRNHAGGENPDTCDSLSEGFAIWLPVLASLQLDAGRGTGFATPDYALSGNLEANLDAPFLYEYDAVSGLIFGTEEFAVAELLWDLEDVSLGEKGFMLYSSPPVSAFQSAAGGTASTSYQPADDIALPGPGIVRLMAAAKAQTVTDLSVLLYAASQLGQESKDLSIDIDVDAANDISILDDVFLLHGFFPRRTDDFVYLVGDPIPATDVYGPLDPATLDYARSGVPSIKGAAIELTNGGDAPATFSVDVAYPNAESHFEVVVAPKSGELVELRLPPYWRTTVEVSKGVPACGAEGHQLVTLSISGAGQPEKKLDSCEYWHLVTAATGPAALTYGNGTSGAGSSARPGASGDPAPTEAPGGGSTVVLIAVVLVVAVAVGVLAFVLARRRGAPRPG